MFSFVLFEMHCFVMFGFVLLEMNCFVMFGFVLFEMNCFVMFGSSVNKGNIDSIIFNFDLLSLQTIKQE